MSEVTIPVPQAARQRRVDETLADLARHPGWAILEARMLAKQEAEAEDLRRFIVRNPAALDTHKLERARGFWSGQRWVFRQANAERKASDELVKKAKAQAYADDS